MDLVITRDGRWIHEGRPIERQRMVELFASVLRREADGHYYLVTPYEKWRIQVEEAPFIAVALDVTEAPDIPPVLTFTTNLGETIALDADHPLEVVYQGDEPRPYILVRPGLWALLSRPVFLALAERAEWVEDPAGPWYGVRSRGQLFFLGPGAEDTAAP